MKILIAEHSGFCFGVKRAIATANQCADARGKVYSLGPLIHNPREINRLGAKIIPVDSLDQIDCSDDSINKVVIIRTHGVGPKVWQAAEAKGLEVIDVTCPFVRKAQLEAESLYKQGYQVVILGDKNHPEVNGIKSWANETAWVVEKAEDVQNLPRAKKIGLIAQTTQQKAVFDEITMLFKGFYDSAKGNLVIKNTICNATANRQKAVADLCEQVETMVIVGGVNSANTKKLMQICHTKGVRAQLVEGSKDLDMALFGGVKSAGVCGGASTPDWIIEEVVGKMVEMEKFAEENAEDQMVAAVGQQELGEEKLADAEVAANAGAEVDQPEEEESFADFYNREMKDIRRGSRIKGTVVQIRDNELLVDIGGKSEGLLPSNQLMDDEAENIREKFKVGDEIDVIVLKKENKEGYPVLSKKMVDQVLVWEKLAETKEAGENVTGKVVEVVKGGLLVDVGIRGFVPASLVDIRFVEDLKTYIGKEVTARILECDRSHNKLLLSPKAVLLEESQKKKEVLWGEISEGQTRDGVVSRLTTFGAFIDLGGVDGLLHVSEMAWFRVNHPSDLLKEGDKVNVFVLSADKETQKISLGLKQLIPDPWSLVAEKYPVDSVVKATVMRTAPFGAFLQLEPGVEGLVHISQLDNKRVAKTEDVVKPGDVVEVKVLEIDADNKRMSLSIRATLPEEEKPVVEAVAPAVEVASEPDVHEEGLGATLGDIFPTEAMEQTQE